MSPSPNPKRSTRENTRTRVHPLAGCKKGGTTLPAEAIKNIDILKHVLVPKCSILSEEEKQKLLERFDISILQLPVISAKDPMTKAIGGKADDVVKIIRTGPPAGTMEYFRRVA